MTDIAQKGTRRKLFAACWHSWFECIASTEQDVRVASAVNTYYTYIHTVQYQCAIDTKAACSLVLAVMLRQHLCPLRL